MEKLGIVFIGRVVRNHASTSADVIGASGCLIGEGAKDAATFDGLTEDELGAAPRVVAAAAIGAQGASEVGGAEADDTIFEPEESEVMLEGGDRFGDVFDFSIKGVESGVHIPAGGVDKEGLPPECATAAGLVLASVDDFDDIAEFFAERSAGHIGESRAGVSEEIERAP